MTFQKIFLQNNFLSNESVFNSGINTVYFLTICVILSSENIIMVMNSYLVFSIFYDNVSALKCMNRL